MKQGSLLFALSGLALVPGHVLAQTSRPDAGQMLQQLTPAPTIPPREKPLPAVEDGTVVTAPEGPRFLVRDIRLRGGTAFPEAELLALVTDGLGKELTLGELDALAARIQRHYREAGYLVARAWVPAQEIHDGVVEIAVQEGRIGQIDVHDQVGLAASALAPLQRVMPGAPVTAETLEGSLLTLADLPGVTVKSTLRPGTTPGTSDLLVDVTPGRTLSGSVDVDNFGNRYTGADRLGASLFWNDPAQLGDQASLRVQTSGTGFTYSRLGYQAPFGADATRVGVAWSAVHYRLGGDFSSLRADGDASVGSLYVLHPLFRSRAASWYGQLQFDAKRLTDRIGSTATVTDKSLQNVMFGINGDLTDGLAGGASTNLSLGLTAGRLSLDSASTTTDQSSAHSRGGFVKSNAALQRLQRLPGDWTLFLSWSGQWAGKNLDSSEKFSLGGAQGVRAYPQGEAAGDEGQLASAELRYRAGDNWELQGFCDGGRVTINRNPWTTSSNHRSLTGCGAGASYAGGGFTLRGFAAWRTAGSEPATSAPDRKPRVWVQGVMYF